MTKTRVILIFILSGSAFLAMTFIKAVPPIRRSQNNTLHTVNIVETSGIWEMLWMQPNNYLVGSLTTTDNSLCYIKTRQKIRMFYPGIWLSCSDIHSGTEKWTGKADGGREISSDHNQVYTRVNPTKFVAYNAEDGQKVWQQSVRARNIRSIVAYDNFVKANVTVGGETNVYQVFDTTTGTHQDNSTAPSMAYHSFASDGQKLFVTEPSYTIAAYGIQDHVQIWETSLGGQIEFQPIFSDGLVFVRTDYAIGTVHAIDGATGRILWEKENVISDIAVSNSTAFYVTVDGEVMAVDAQTGKTQGRLILDTEELVVIDDDNAYPYYVSAVDDMVFVYFGDTWQLFAFRFSLE